MKKLSCGTIIRSNGTILLGHVTGQSNWDIPKGQLDAGESTLQAALRELQEETGIVLPEDADIKELGLFKYRSDKDLYLYDHTLEMHIPSETLECSSYFTNPYGAQQLEIDDFMYVDYSLVERYVTSNMYKVLRELL